MANGAVSLNLLDLDYDSLANNFTQYAASLPEFQGYDFKSGALASIIKILSYNSWLTSYYTNMAISESFLDTAQLQESVFSHAKELGYTPRSATSAQAQIKFTFQGQNPVYTIAKGQQFSALVRGGGSLLFAVPENVTLISTNSLFSANLTIYEGTYVADAYTMNYSDPDQRFLLTNPNVDTSSITVAVSTSSVLTPNVYVQANTLLGLDETSQVWFLQAAETGQFEVLFGDGVIAYRPPDSSTIIIDYRVTVGANGNGAQVFTPSFVPYPGNVSAMNVVTLTPSVLGQDIQSPDSVRFYAPRYFQIQQRAVTAYDYSIMLRNQFPEVVDAFAYGGETLTPPQYNKVFVAVNLSGIQGLPDSKVQAYTNFLQARCPLTVVPVIVAAQYQYLSVNSTVTYDTTVTTLTPSDIQSEVVLAMQNYANTNLGSFNSNLRYSRFVATIDEADQSIISNQTNYYVYQIISPIKGGTPQNIAVPFNYPLAQAPVNPSVKPTIVEEYNIWTGSFIFNGQQSFLADDNLGNLRLVIAQGGSQLYSAIYGTVDYESGLVTLQNFAPQDYNGSTMRVYARPADSDISSPQSTVISLGDELFVTIVPSS